MAGEILVASAAGGVAAGAGVVNLEAVVIRASSAPDADVVNALPEGLAVVAEAVEETADRPDSLARAYQRANHDRARSVPPGRQRVVAVGPLLDGPDRVEVRSAHRRGNLISVAVDFTMVREEGVALRRNLPWRPMVVVSFELPLGDYRARVVWHKIRKTPARGRAAPTEVVRELGFSVAEHPPSK